MKINILYRYIRIAALSALFILSSCGAKKGLSPGDHLKLAFTDEGQVMQATGDKANHRRLYFSYGIKDAGFAGTENVEAFAKINKDSLPADIRSKFWGVVFHNSDGLPIHQTLLDKSYYYRELEENPDYFVVNYSGVFFVDIPLEVDLKGTTQVHLVDLNENKIAQTFPIDDITKEYINPFNYEEGWNGEKKIYKIHGNTDAAHAFDFVILTEGFTAEELQMETFESMMNSKFGGYVKQFILPLLETAPYKSKKDQINIWVVATPSLESGVSNPFQNKKRRTTYRATFGANCTERSLVVRDQERALKMASLTPFDQAIVLVNDETYGGQGSDIATFSVHSSAPYLIKHELAHAVGLMADEYKYYSDTRARTSCEEHLMETYATHNRKNWGRNRYFEQDTQLAPNLSNQPSPTQVKWAQLLTDDSPIVFFDYPKEDSKLDLETQSLSVEFKASFDRDELLITMGLLRKLNAVLKETTEVQINGDVVDYEMIKMQSGHRFLKVPKRSVKKGDLLNIRLEFKEADLQTLSWIEHYTKSYHLITLASRSFQGNSEQLGIFQGSNVHPYKTFRSSYINIMNSSSVMSFDQWQEKAYGDMISHYIQLSQHQ